MELSANTLYSDAGVREYLIVDPAKNRTTIYRYEEDAAPTIIPFDQQITVGIYSGLSITIWDLLESNTPQQATEHQICSAAELRGNGINQFNSVES